VLTWGMRVWTRNVMAPHSLNPWACVKNRLRGRPPLFCYKSPAILILSDLAVQEESVTDLNASGRRWKYVI
jgi:hypothetical protein